MPDDHTPPASASDFADFPEGAHAAYGASYAGALAGALGPALTLLGGQVNLGRLAMTATRAGLTSGFDNGAILRAIAADADNIFLSDFLRPYIVDGLNAFAKGMSAKLAYEARAQGTGDAPFIA